MTAAPPDAAGLERERRDLQAALDAARPASVRNRRGQFATPPALAEALLCQARDLWRSDEPVRFLDPALGTGAFYAALLRVFPQVAAARAYEIDPHYGRPAARLWRDTRLDLRLADFTRAAPPPPAGRFNLLVCNPPYVRHHHLDRSAKQRMRARVRECAGMDVNGLAGLHCYFMGLAHPWLADGGLACWLLPGEFMDVNYADAMRRYLLERTTLLGVHRFDDADLQFGDAQVSSAVVWMRRQAPPAGHRVLMSRGGAPAHPERERRVAADDLAGAPKWHAGPQPRTAGPGPRLADWFDVRRGLATGCNRYFILTECELTRRGLPRDMFRPILPPARRLSQDAVRADASGRPLTDPLLHLLDCRLSEDEVRRLHPRLWAYLQEGRSQGVPDRHTCRRRTPWYAQDHRPPAPFLCTYMGRPRSGRKPFRFILNHSQATASNAYLMLYPKARLARTLQAEPPLAARIHDLLNAIEPARMLAAGRVYGGGLYKLEPKELGRVPLPVGDLRTPLPAALQCELPAPTPSS